MDHQFFHGTSILVPCYLHLSTYALYTCFVKRSSVILSTCPHSYLHKTQYCLSIPTSLLLQTRSSRFYQVQYHNICTRFFYMLGIGHVGLNNRQLTLVSRGCVAPLAPFREHSHDVTESTTSRYITLYTRLHKVKAV